MVRSAHPQRRFVALLHAAAVAPAGGPVVVIAGDSGSGKSTLCASLVSAGLRYLADDIVPLDAERTWAWPVPLAISVKQGSWPVLESRFPRLVEAPVGRVGNVAVRYLWPRERVVAVASGGMPVGVVVFPRYQSGAVLSVSAVAASETLSILGNTGSILPKSADALGVFLGWLDRVPAFQLTYGCLDDAIAAVCRISR